MGRPLLARVRGADPRLADGALAALVGVVELAGVVLGSRQQGEPGLTVPGAALLVATIVPLAWRRRSPVTVWAVTGLATSVYGAVELPDPPLPLGSLVAVYTVAAHCPRRTSVAVAATTGVAVLLAVVMSGDSDALDFYLGYLLFGLAWILGDRQQIRRAVVAEEARRAVTEERARISRELHDVVAHHVSMMVVQAEAGASVAGVGRAAGAGGDADGPERTIAAFEAIAATGRDAMAELRRLLGVLRDEDGPAPTAPQPGIDRVEELVAQVGAAGLPVELRVEGSPRPLPAGLALSAYRIIQEALTNALRHAGPARATVVLRYGDETLELEVADDGKGTVSAPAPGRGLLGIRERVALAGGSFEAGPRPGGGFGVTARLPLRG